MVSSAAPLPSALNAVSIESQPGSSERERCTHAVLADALAMRSRGEPASEVVCTLTNHGLTSRQAHKALAAIDRQLGHARATTRRIHVLVVAGIAVQLLLALVMASLSMSAAPIPALVALAIVARACRPDRLMLRRLSRQQHLLS